MNFAQFLLQTDAWRMILVEARPSQYITPFAWIHRGLSGWTERKLFALPIPTADQVDFPVKVPIVLDSPESIAIGALCRADGFDIRFTAADGVTLLPYERESFAVADGEASGIFWVKTDVATAGTHIWCYYGNASAPDGEDAENVWNADFKAVYHMKDATTSTIKDSTSNHADGTKTAADNPIEAAGKIALGQDFGGDDEIHSSPPLINETSSTMEFWINATLAGQITPIEIGNFILGNGTRRVDINATGAIIADYYLEDKAIAPNGTVTPNNWHHIIVTFDGTTKLIYEGGVPVASSVTAAIDVNASILNLGGLWSWIQYVDGMMDEVRVSSIARSADWNNYNFTNQSAADGGLTWGAEETNYGNLWTTPYVRVVDAVTENDTEYAERFTFAECDNNAGSFYYDYDNGLLYLHTTGSNAPDTETVPGTTDYTIVAFSWRYFVNAHYKDFKAVYPRLTEALLDGGFEEWADALTPDRWTPTTAGTSTVNRETSGVHGGGYCVRLDIDGSNSEASVSENIRCVPGGKIKLAVWYKHSGAATSKIIIRDSGSNVYLVDDGTWSAAPAEISLSNKAAWTKYTFDVEAHPDYTNYVIELASDAATSASCYFDDASLRLVREDNIYLPYLVGTGSPNIQQAVGEFQDGAMVMEAGAIQFLNPGFWYTEDSDFLWGQKDIRIRAGAKAAAYDDCEQVFFGLTRPPVVTDNIAVIETTDRKALLFRDVPPLKYDTATYPKLDPNVVGQSIPIIYGEFSRVPAVCIDTDNFIYKTCGHEVEEITSVWYDDVELTETIDYTLDEANGQLTLLFDPEQAFISAGVKGRKCSLDDGTYSTNVADIFVDLFITYSGILKRQLDFASLLDLRAQRTQEHCVYIGSSQVTFEIVRQLQAGAIFHTIPLADGRIAAYRYREGTTSSTPNLKSVELSNFQKAKSIETVYRDIEIGYNFDVVAGTFSFVRRTNADVERLHNIKETISIMTTLKLLTEAENIADFYQALSAFPMKKISATVPSKAFSVQAGPGKLVITKSKSLESGDEQSVLLDAPYRVTDIKKNLHTGTVDVEAIDDLQSGGSLICEDCYACQVCNEVQEGTCSLCYACELCNAGQTCDECQVCYYCEKCNAGECTSCETCDACQDCDTCQTTQCSICVSCQVGDVCGLCLLCFECENCNTCEYCNRGECTKVG